MNARTALGAAALVALAASAALAQYRGRPGYYDGRPARYATMADFDGGYQFCRLVFRQGNGDGAGWNVDWPRADINLSIRLAELSRVSVSMEGPDMPRTVLVRLNSAEIFHCPFVMMTEPGAAYFDEEEARRLREYLLKGGFLWADDFWGDYAWEYWESMLRRALPSAEFPIVELDRDHTIFQQMLNARDVPQIPGIGYWDGANRTSERGPETVTPHYRAILDSRGRVMVLMTFNTDFGDSYEREAANPLYFQRFSVPGYAFGINAIIYAMTH